MMADPRPTRGYATAAPLYVGGGWQPFPLPAGHKSPPPKGYTGQDGRAPTVADVTRWCSSNPHGNVGLHLSGTVVGVDVDDYEGKEGGRTLSDLEAAHGPLPRTWSSTSRGEGVSRIMFFRIPDGVTFPGVLGSGIDVIQAHHRYAVVAPSTHPDSGERYRWYTPEGTVATAPPRVDDLPNLPDAWVEALRWRPPTQEPEATTPRALQPEPRGTQVGTYDSIAARIADEHNWHDVLIGDGWQLTRTKTGTSEWTRPGKDQRAGISAVLHEPDGPFNVFTSSVAALQQPWAERKAGTLWSFSMFGYLAATRHNGDRSACARDYRAQANATDALYRTVQTATIAAQALDDEPGAETADGLQIIDWTEQRDPSVEVIEGLAIGGRWTAIAAAAKAGKSTLLITLSVEISEGRDPYDGHPCEPVDVLYIDAEMGRLDLEERLTDGGYNPTQLRHWHACEIPPRLDTPEGAALVIGFVRDHDIQLVVIDGINGVVAGAEKDDSPWRDLYDHTIRKLKEMGVAVITADNLGKDKTLGPRGSSVKVDKADAVIQVTRTESGTKLHTSHRRTAAYPTDVDLDIVGLDGTGPIRYRRRGGPAWPAGTKAATLVLDELGLPIEVGRPTVLAALHAKVAECEAAGVDPGRYQMRTNLIAAAIRWRKVEAGGVLLSASRAVPDPGNIPQMADAGTVAGTPTPEMPSDQGGNSGGNTWEHLPRVDGNSGGCSGTEHPLLPNPTAQPDSDEPDIGTEVLF